MDHHPVLTALWVTLAGIIIASVFAILFLLLRLAGGKTGHAIVSIWVSVFRNTPLLVQLLFWYFAAWNGLPAAFRDVINTDHTWSILPGDVWWFTPEFLCVLCLGFGRFHLCVSHRGDRIWTPCRFKRATTDALAQGFSAWRLFRYILLPQGLANAWQPVVGQYLNLMKLSSLASGIGFAELTYQVRQIKL